MAWMKLAARRIEETRKALRRRKARGFVTHLLRVALSGGIDSIRCMSEHRTLTITATRWQWHKTKDWLHFYFFVGAIPISIFVFMMNVFVGPATLEPIPEGYVPKYWEYYRSPVVRLLARYLFSQPQKEYEKGLYFIVHDMEVKQVRDLQSQVKEYIRNKQDYPAFGYHSGIQATMVKEYRKRIDTEGL